MADSSMRRDDNNSLSRGHYTVVYGRIRSNTSSNRNSRCAHTVNYFDRSCLLSIPFVVASSLSRSSQADRIMCERLVFCHTMDDLLLVAR